MVRDKSVLLTYSNKNRMKYQECAEFFRLIGVYVCENYQAKGNEPGIETQTDFQYNLDDDSEIDLEEQFINFMSHDELQADSNGEIAKEVEKIFQSYHLLQASVTLQYFCINTSIVGYAGELFSNAAKNLEDYSNDNLDKTKPNYQIRYAILYCKQKANLAKSLLDEVLCYPIADLLKEASCLQEEFPNCSNTWMLIGMICEISKEYKMKAIEVLKKAADTVNGKVYSTSILYRLGKNCEGMEELEYLKNDSYEQAYNIMPKYRNIYKLARQYMDMEIWELAIGYFKQCLEKINWHGEYLDPLEQEYYFKVCSHLAYIYNQMNDYVSAIRYAERALDFKNDIYDAKDDLEGYNKMYYDVYKELAWEEKEKEDWNPKNIIEVELKRMSTKNIYHHLAVAYQGLGIDDVAGEYWNLVKS